MIVKYEHRALSAQNPTSVHRYKDLQNLPHWHMEHELIFVSSGKIDLIVNNTPYILTENEAAFVKSEEIHLIKASPDSITEVMKIHTESLRHIIGSQSLADPILHGAYPIREVLDEIRTELKNGQLFSEAIATSLMTVLVARIFRNEKTTESDRERTNSDHRYKALMEHLQKNYRHISFDEAAKFMHFSKPYFSTYFYNRTGMSFTHYLNMLRVSAAARLVAERELRMAEISDLCGFGTIRSFNRVFKELTGYNPSDLPHDYVFHYASEPSDDTDFDPTLNCTTLLD